MLPATRAALNEAKDRGNSTTYIYIYTHSHTMYVYNIYTYTLYIHKRYVYTVQLCNYIVCNIYTHIILVCMCCLASWIFHVCPGYFGDSGTTTKHPFLMSECFALWLLSALLCGFSLKTLIIQSNKLDLNWLEQERANTLRNVETCMQLTSPFKLYTCMV